MKLFIVCISLSGCGDLGPTCGRGRCDVGETCISVFGANSRQNQGWMDQYYPDSDNEWWCVQTSCPALNGCQSQMCLRDPGDNQVLVCATTEAAVAYRSNGTSCLCDANHVCKNNQTVTGMEIIDTCSTTHKVLQSCTPGQDCAVGTFQAGATLPGVRLFSDAGEFDYCPVPLTDVLGGQLPANTTIRLYVDGDNCTM
jgi:hypothetical protein